MKARIHMLANTSGTVEHLPKVLASFLVAYPAISDDVEECESTEIAIALASGAAALPSMQLCPKASIGFRFAMTVWC
jgi:hypothetical protein